jgi:hypothetical protein
VTSDTDKTLKTTATVITALYCAPGSYAFVVGERVGRVGETDGRAVGERDGDVDGDFEGDPVVGRSVGALDGAEVGVNVSSKTNDNVCNPKYDESNAFAVDPFPYQYTKSFSAKGTTADPINAREYVGKYDPTVNEENAYCLEPTCNHIDVALFCCPVNTP